MKQDKQQPNPTPTEVGSLPLINPRAAAKYLGISTRCVRRLAAQLRIPHYDICGKIRFSPDEIQAWLDERIARAADPTRRGGP